MNSNTQKAISDFLQTYPLSRLDDVYKFLHQSSLGCGHLIADEAKAERYIQEEASTMQGSWPLVQQLDGPYVRLGLNWLNKGLRASTLARQMALSASIPEDGKRKLEEKLAVLLTMAKNSKVPFEASEVDDFITKHRLDGFPAIHHSGVFKNAYHPAYRVVSERFYAFMDMFCAIDQGLSSCSKEHFVVAVEGSSASGKTTVSAMLNAVFDCTVFHMDDFFLRPEQRTPERFAQPGGNVDRERFLEQVVEPLERGENIDYVRFDCGTFQLLPAVLVKPTKLVVVEGSYSMHPELRNHWDLSVFLDIDLDLQRQRILKRNTPESARKFFDRWIPFERRYLEAFTVKKSCDLVVKVR